jgi:hypothetical protein
VTRQCGSCTLCCKLLPMAKRPDDVYGAVHAMVDAGLATYAEYAGSRAEWTKPAGARCQHQRRTGCAIYGDRPASCRMWSCRWLSGDDTADLSRPDRAHYVIDVVPDYVVLRNNETGKHHHLPVVVIWLDPDYPDAHRDPALRAYLLRRGEERTAALFRLSERKGFALFPPQVSDDGQWHEVQSDAVTAQHDAADIFRTLAAAGLDFLGTAAMSKEGLR